MTSELQAHHPLLRAVEREKLESARNAVAELLVHVSPHAPLLDPDSLEVLMDLSFRVRGIRSGRAR